MIQDLDGATTEPARRRHVEVLSAFVAAASLVLLYVLLVPAPGVDPPSLAASPAPRPTNGAVVTWQSLIPSDRGGPFEESLRDVAMTLCVASAEWTPLQLTVFDSNGRPIADYTSVPTGRPDPPQPDHWGEFRFVPWCAKSDDP